MATDRETALYWESRAAEHPLPEDPSGRGTAREPTCSDLLEIGLTVNPQGMITAAGFSLTETACTPIRAAAAYACAVSEGRHVFAVSLMKTKDLYPALSKEGGPDPEHLHCLLMAEVALKQAIADYAAAFKRS